MTILEILEQALNRDASDIFIIAGLPVTVKCKGSLVQLNDEMLKPAATAAAVDEIYDISKRERTNVDGRLDDDFSFSIPQFGRFRVNVFRQRGSLAAVLRVIRYGLPDPAEIGIPELVLQLADNRKGLVLVAGSAGSGKSTTLACMIDRINQSRSCHIITMEDPIEYIHRHNKSIVTQREIFIDTPGYLEALRSALRESPDVILLGEMRDFDTISSAITAAETGTLLFSTLHTSSASNTINRIIDVFPASQQSQVKIQLSQILRGVICQQLIPSAEGGLVPSFEVLKMTPAVQNMIREETGCTVECREHMRGGDGTVQITNLVLSNEELNNKGRLFARLTLNPGCSIGYHVHETDSEIFYITKGTGIYSDNGEEKTVTAGDVTICPAGTGHSIANRSDEVLELTALIVFA